MTEGAVARARATASDQGAVGSLTEVRSHGVGCVASKTRRFDNHRRQSTRRTVLTSMLFAVVGRFVEGMGAVHCGCAANCWCQRPVLSTFGWVFAWRHHLRSEI